MSDSPEQPADSKPTGPTADAAADVEAHVDHAAARASDRRLSLRVVTLPRDTNQYGTIFGGVILSSIDQAGFVEARRHGAHRWVTVAMDRVEFIAPVHLGDIVSFYTRTLRLGTKSVTVAVDVEAERYDTEKIVPVTAATLTMVSVNADGEPIPFRSPSTVRKAARGLS